MSQFQSKIRSCKHPHNPSCATVTPEFYQKLVDMAKEKDSISFLILLLC